MTTQATAPSHVADRGEPDSPLDLPAPRWRDGVKKALTGFKEDRGSFAAAGMAFYWFLSIFPALLAAVGIAGLAHISAGTVASIRRGIESALPGDAAGVLTQALQQASSRARGGSAVAAIVGLLVAVWSATAGMTATQSGLDVAYDVPQDRSFVSRRVRALELLVAAVVLGGIATAAIVFGRSIGDALRDHLPFGAAFIVVWTVVRWVVGLFALATLFAVFYYLGPNRESPRWTWLSVGGAVATVIWLLGSLGFSFYVSNLGSYAKTYGSLTGVVVLMLWLYLSAIAVIFGAEVNSALEAEGAQMARQPKQARQPQPQTETRPVEAPATTPRDSYEESWLDQMRRVREGSG